MALFTCFQFQKKWREHNLRMNRRQTTRIILFVQPLASGTTWLERVLIALSQSDSNLSNEYNSMLTRKLHLAQKSPDEDLILLLADKRKFFRYFGAES